MLKLVNFCQLFKLFFKAQHITDIIPSKLIAEVQHSAWLGKTFPGGWLGGWGKAGKKANLIQLELTIGWAWQLWNIFCKIGPHCVQCIFAFDTIWSSYQGTVWDRIKFYFITMAERFIMCIVKTLVSYFLHYTMKTEKQSL